MSSCRNCFNSGCNGMGKHVRTRDTCWDYQSRPKTNADSIRSMSDDELEMFILKAEVNATKHALDTEWEGDFPLNWLQQPAKEADNG